MWCIFIVFLYIIIFLLFFEVKIVCVIKDIKNFFRFFCNIYRFIYIKNLYILMYKFLMIELKGKFMINE